MKKSAKKIVQDRTIYEDASIFAPNLHAMGLMTTRDFENYADLFGVMDEFITPPDLLIYLRASVPALVENIQREDLNSIEVALSYQRLIEECNLTQEQMSQKIAKSRSSITNHLRLLKLPAQIQTGIKK